MIVFEKSTYTSYSFIQHSAQLLFMLGIVYFYSPLSEHWLPSLNISKFYYILFSMGST